MCVYMIFDKIFVNAEVHIRYYQECRIRSKISLSFYARLSLKKNHLSTLYRLDYYSATKSVYASPDKTDSQRIYWHLYRITTSLHNTLLTSWIYNFIVSSKYTISNLLKKKERNMTAGQANLALLNSDVLWPTTEMQ